MRRRASIRRCKKCRRIIKTVPNCAYTSKLFCSNKCRMDWHNSLRAAAWKMSTLKRKNPRKTLRRAYRFELFEDITGGFRVRLVSARNEKTLWMTSEAYFSRSNARRSFRTLLFALEDFSFEDLTSHGQTKNSPRSSKHKRVLGKRRAQATTSKSSSRTRS